MQESTVSNIAVNIIIILLLLFLFFGAGCAGKQYHPYYPRMIVIKEGEGYFIQACRLEEGGSIICEYTLDYYEDKEFFCFPKSDYDR
jgi:hypothetical protein